jgi:hypothetical protein
LQASLTPGGQKRLASAQVGLRFQGAPGLEVLTHPAHGRHTETGERRNFSGAFALFVKVDDSFADWKRDRSHGHTLPHRPVFVKLYYLWKCFSDENISYFGNVDAATNGANMILTGDRHLESNGNPVKPGLFVFTNGMAMGWTSELHGNSANNPVGLMSFADGHAQRVLSRDSALTKIFGQQGLTTDRLLVP